MHNLAPSFTRYAAGQLISPRGRNHLMLALATSLTLLTAVGRADEPTTPTKADDVSGGGGVTIRLQLVPSAPELEPATAPLAEVAEPAARVVTNPRKGEAKPAVESVASPKPLPGKRPAPRLQPARRKGAETTLGEENALATERGRTRDAAAEKEHSAGGALFKDEAVNALDVATRRSGGSSLKLTDKREDLDFSNELRGSADEATLDLTLEPDDVPLEHEDPPFDAPAAEATARAAESEDGDTVVKLEQFSPRELKIEADIRRCLDYYISHPENTTRRGPWALMHAALPLGVESEVLAGNRRVNTLGWLAFNGACGKQNMFQPTTRGFRPNVGPGVQGHEGQFLAILAQSRVKADYPLQVSKRRYTVMDLARYEMSTCREKSELTFKLIGLSHYLEPNARWRDDRGHNWTLEKIVAEELAQPINGAACGGTHRLMGLSYAVIKRQAAGQPLSGHWGRAKQYLNDYVNYAMSLQNPDGSFSSNWFESRGLDPDMERRVQTTGHILEWLIYTLPDDHLRSPRIQLSVEFLLNTVGREPERDWPIGPRGHALRAMSLYSQRVFGAEPGKMRSYVVQSGDRGNLR